MPHNRDSASKWGRGREGNTPAMVLHYSPVEVERVVRLGLIPLSFFTLEGIMCSV